MLVKIYCCIGENNIIWWFVGDFKFHFDIFECDFIVSTLLINHFVSTVNIIRGIEMHFIMISSFYTRKIDQEYLPRRRVSVSWNSDRNKQQLFYFLWWFWENGSSIYIHLHLLNVRLGSFRSNDYTLNILRQDTDNFVGILLESDLRCDIENGKFKGCNFITKFL